MLSSLNSLSVRLAVAIQPRLPICVGLSGPWPSVGSPSRPPPRRKRGSFSVLRPALVAMGPGCPHATRRNRGRSAELPRCRRYPPVVGRILHQTAAASGLAAALALPLGAGAQARVADLPARPLPWATVNVCDTGGHPDGVGVRGWMPGHAGAGVRLELRIRLQYRRGAGWLAVKGADSGWILASSGDRRSAEAGQTFTVTPPRAGGAFVLRGLVAFRWRDADGVLLR